MELTQGQQASQQFVSVSSFCCSLQQVVHSKRAWEQPTSSEVECRWLPQPVCDCAYAAAHAHAAGSAGKVVSLWADSWWATVHFLRHTQKQALQQDATY